MQHFQTPTAQSTLRRRLTTYLVALTGACLAMLPQGLYAYDSLASPVPAEIKVPEGYSPFLQGHAVGTQNYICLSSGASMAWSFIGPQATLFDDDRTQSITHFLSLNPEEEDTARATWQDSQDTSAVWARPKPGAAVVVKPGAIPWLLLEVVGTDRGPTGGRWLTETKYIQRLYTKGGLAPSSGCEQPSDMGKREFVPYEAEYVFYKATGRE